MPFNHTKHDFVFIILLFFKRGTFMIFEFLISIVVLCLNTFLCTVVCGSTIRELFYFSENLLLFLLLVILTAFIFLSGYSKTFLKIFYTHKKIKTLQLSQLKKIETSLEYASKIVGYEAIFFILIGVVFYYVNWQNIQTLGAQLSLIIKSSFFLSLIEIILFTLKSKLKNQMILYMAEDESLDKNEKYSMKKNIFTIFTVILSIAVIASVAILIVNIYTENEADFDFTNIAVWIDVPSILFLILPLFLLLTSTGLLKNFLSGIKSAFTSQKLPVSKKLLYINTNKYARTVILLSAISSSLTGYYAVLKHLESKMTLGSNMMIATIPIFYALFINLFLLTVGTKLESLSEKTDE